MQDYSKMFEKIFKEEKTNNNNNSNTDKKEFEDNLYEKINFISNMQKIFDSMTLKDKSVEFIKALKPLLEDSLQKKADESIKMLKIFNLIPILKENGILN